MRVNQAGEEVFEETLFKDWGAGATVKERDEAIGFILEKLGYRAVRTNATKHGNTELEFREEGMGE